jgi:DNA-binding NarL/FixJ family response regulator
VGECADGPTAVRLARRLDPDVICMDVRMPGGDGLAATREITSAGSAPAVLVVTTFDLDEYVFGALEAGASGFILKDTEPDDLVDAVRRLASGYGLVDQAVTRRVIAEFARRRPTRTAAVDPAHQLTPRETDIVRLLAQGMSNAEIARELVIETSTVKSHLGRVLTKIGVRDRLQTVVWAYQNGVVQ